MRLKLVIFTSQDCGVCQHLKKNVLPLFKKDLPDLPIEEVQISMDGNDITNPEGEARADAYEIEAFPTFVFEAADILRGGGESATLSGLKKLVAQAQKKLDGMGGGKS